MNKFKRFTIFLMIFLVMIIFEGCGQQRESGIRNADESIMLSNILFEGMEMNEEQEATLRVAKEIRENAAYDSINNVFSAKNTSDQTLNATFMMTCYDENDRIIYGSKRTIDEWKSGGMLRIDMTSAVDTTRTELAVQLVCGDIFVRTAFANVCQSSEERSVEIMLAAELPATLTINEDVYRITDFSYFATGSYSDTGKLYSIDLSLIKEFASGKNNTRFEYRFVGQDGVTYGQGIYYGGYMETGETLRVRQSSVTLPDGKYTMELYGENVSMTN